MEPVRLGVIGCGVVSGSHLDLAAKCPEAKVVAVADLIEERARSKAAQYNVPGCYLNDKDLLKDRNVEAVILAMPAGVRTPVAYRALKSGRHVLLEKPVASRVAEVEKMMSLQKDRVVACCSPRMTFTGHAEAAARCVASGALGAIRIVRVRAVWACGDKPADNPPPWRESMVLNGGGILVNWGCYDLNYLMDITGWQLQPQSIMAQWWPVGPRMTAYAAPGSDADAHYIALIRCQDGIVISMERGEFTTAATEQAWEIIGTEATLHMPMLPPVGRPNAVMIDRFVPGKGLVSEPVWEEKDGGGGGDVVSDFVRAIRHGSEPRTGIRRALVMQKITDGMYRSASSGKSVAVK